MKTHRNISPLPGIVAVLAVSLTALNGAAQESSLERTLERLSEDAARRYVAPVSSALGADLNGGWFHRAPDPRILGFNLELGLTAMASIFPDDATHFSTSGTFTFSVSEAQELTADVSDAQLRSELIDALTSTPSRVTIEGATIIGSPDDPVKIRYPGGTYNTSQGAVSVPPAELALPVAGLGELADAGALPFAAPQVTVGTLLGTEATFRFLPPSELVPELGELKYFGFGIQHNPMVWFRDVNLPFNVAVGFYSQSLTVGDVLDIQTTAFGLNVSKRLGFRFLNITPYAGLMLEKAEMEATYRYVIDTPAGERVEDIRFSLEGENKARLTLGLSIRFLIANLNFDYNIAKYSSATAGLYFAL